MQRVLKGALLVIFSFLTNLAFAHHPILEGFISKKITTGLNATSMIQAPDGRFFITEKDGRVRIVKKGKLLETPFLTLTVDNEGERGIQSVVLDPNFDVNNYIYVYYSVFNGNHNRVSRFIANGDVVLQGSETILLELDQLSSTVHNGGAMKFGLDSTLYISTGDGGWDADGPQRLNSLKGKILRINTDGSIPEDNPFYNSLQGKYRTIYAQGLRNPFTMSFNPATGRLFVNDVGFGKWEEVNEVIPKANFGWPIHEGPVSNSSIENYQNPIYAYDHDQGCAITGSAFLDYDNSTIPEEYQGLYVFGEYCRGHILLFDPVAHVVVDTLISEIYTPVSFIAGQDGHFYYLNRGETSGQFNSNAGELWQISYVGTGEPFVSDQSKNELYTVDEDARFSVVAGGQGDLSFSWIDKNDNPIPDETASEIVFDNVQLADSGSVFYCIVSNAFGKDTSKPFVLRVTDNLRPITNIITPDNESFYSGGDSIVIKGEATDPENGEFDASAYVWTVLFHHDDHVHPGLSFAGDDSLTFVVPTIGEVSTNVWYEIILSVQDDVGLTSVASHRINPFINEVQVFSSPQELQINIDGTPTMTNFKVDGVVGVLRSLYASPLQQKGDIVYRFSHWSNGSLSNVLNFAAADTAGVLIAYYEKDFTNTADDNQLFPNPTEGKFRLVIDSRWIKTVKYYIYDGMQREVQAGDFSLQKGENVVDVNVSHLKAGVYYFYTDLPEPNRYRRFIIH